VISDLDQGAFAAEHGLGSLTVHQGHPAITFFDCAWEVDDDRHLTVFVNAALKRDGLSLEPWSILLAILDAALKPGYRAALPGVVAQEEAARGVMTWGVEFDDIVAGFAEIIEVTEGYYGFARCVAELLSSHATAEDKEDLHCLIRRWRTNNLFGLNQVSAKGLLQYLALLVLAERIGMPPKEEYDFWMSHEGGLTVLGYTRVIDRVIFSESPKMADILAVWKCAYDYLEPNNRSRVKTSCVVESAEGDSMPTLFISYGQPDEDFAKRLSDALKGRGFQTWLFADDAVAGERLHRMMHTGVNGHDKMIVVCSKESLDRSGVLNELERVLAREAREGGTQVVVPIRRDDYIFKGWSPSKADVADQLRERVVADFRSVATAPEMDAAVDRLVAGLPKI